MKKNKTIAYALAATLLVGGTFVGTKALFTTQATAESDLVITTGNLVLEDITEKELGYDQWIPKKIDIEVSGKHGTNNEFENVKPNTGFNREIVLKNTGSLGQNIDISGGKLEANDIFEGTVKFKLVDERGSTVIETSDLSEISKNNLWPDEKLYIYYDVDVKDIGNEHQSKTYKLNDVFSSIQINSENLPHGTVPQ